MSTFDPGDVYLPPHSKVEMGSDSDLYTGDSIQQSNSSFVEEELRSRSRNAQGLMQAFGCECGLDLYNAVLGPTADEAVLKGFKTITDFFGKFMKCADRDECHDDESSNGAERQSAAEVISKILESMGLPAQVASRIVQTSLAELERKSPSLVDRLAQTSRVQMLSNILENLGVPSESVDRIIEASRGDIRNYPGGSSFQLSKHNGDEVKERMRKSNIRIPDPYRNPRNPSNFRRDPSAIRRDPSRAPRDPTNFQRQPSGMRRDPSNVRRDPSRLPRDPSAFNKQPSGIARNPSNFNRDPSGLVTEPSGISQRPSENSLTPSVFTDNPSGVVRDSSGVNGDASRLSQDYSQQEALEEGEEEEGENDCICCECGDEEPPLEEKTCVCCKCASPDDVPVREPSSQSSTFKRQKSALASRGTIVEYPREEGSSHFRQLAKSISGMKQLFKMPSRSQTERGERQKSSCHCGVPEGLNERRVSGSSRREEMISKKPCICKPVNVTTYTKESRVLRPVKKSSSAVQEWSGEGQAKQKMCVCCRNIVPEDETSNLVNEDCYCSSESCGRKGIMKSMECSSPMVVICQESRISRETKKTPKAKKCVCFGGVEELSFSSFAKGDTRTVDQACDCE